MPSDWKTRIGLKLPIRLPRTEVLVIAGAALLAFVITLIVVASSTGARTRQAAAAALQERKGREKPPLFSPEELALSPEDFLVPAPPSVETSLRYAPFRPRLTRWSEELASRYWVAPRQITREIVESINDKEIQRLFQDVP